MIQNKQLEQKSVQEKQIQQEQSLIEQTISLTKQIHETNEHLKSFEENIEQQATFLCEKIQTNCPFIKAINKKTFDQLEDQKQVFLKKKLNLEQELQQKTNELENNRKSKNENNNEKFLEETQTFENNIKQQEQST